MPASSGRAAALLLAALPLCGCQDDDEPPCLTFTPAASPASGTVSTTSTLGSQCDLLELQLLISDVPDVFAVSLGILYDPATVAFAGLFPEGALLDADGTPLAVEVSGPEGALSAGVTRISTTGIDASGTRVLLRMRFSRLGGAGATPLTFDRPTMLGSETPPQEKPWVVWSGGVIEIL
jgi:hypothetical protein